MFKEGNVIEVSYTAKENESGAVFDTTVKENAEKAGIYNENVKYEPRLVILGEHELLPGLEKAVKEMGLGETKNITLNAEEGFGERRAELVRVVSLAEFKKQKMQPFPGLVVEINNVQGRVQTVSGGRVRIDFNHPLAGKTVEYEIKIEKELNTEEEKVKAVLGKYFSFIEGKYSFTVKEKEKKLEEGKKGEKKGAEEKEKFLELLIAEKEKMSLAKGIVPFVERKLRNCTGIEKIELKKIMEESKEEKN